MGLWDSYLRDVWNDGRRYANWPPDAPLEVGWYGAIDKGEFTYAGTLQGAGVAIEEKRKPARNEGEYTSKNMLKVNWKAAGSADTSLFPNLTKADAGFSGEYGREGASAVRTVNAEYRWIAEPVEARRAVLGLIRAKQWDQSYFVIERIVAAETGFVTLGRQAGGQVNIIGKAQVTGGKAMVNFGVSGSSASGDTTVLKSEWVPFYNPFRLQRHWWEKLRDALFPPRAGVLPGISSGAPRDIRGIKPADIAAVDQDLLMSLFTDDPEDIEDDEPDPSASAPRGDENFAGGATAGA